MNVHTCRDSRDNKYLVFEYNMTVVKISSKYKSKHFNSQIKFVILLTVNHTILAMLVQRI